MEFKDYVILTMAFFLLLLSIGFFFTILRIRDIENRALKICSNSTVYKQICNKSSPYEPVEIPYFEIN